MVDKESLRRLWEDPAVTKVAFNAAFEIVWLSHVYGWTIRGPVCDPQIAAHLLDENLASYTLQNLATHYLGAPQWKADWEPYEKSLSGLTYLPSEYESPLTRYNTQDVHWTTQLHRYQRPLVASQGLQRLYRVEMENLKTLARMTAHGIQINQELLNDWRRRFQTEITNLAASVPFNLDSPSQVLQALREAGYRVDSTGAEILGSLNGALPRKVLRYRRLGKLLHTYLDGLAKHVYADGRIHPSFHQYRTVSGRLSSSDPNSQNFPRDTGDLPFRQLFRGSWENLLRTDFNQLELRIAAHYAGGKLLDVYRAGKDIHSATGERIWSKRQDQITENERVVSKITNFIALYDPFDTAIGSVKLQCAEGGVQLSWWDAKDTIQSFRGAYPEWWLYYAQTLRHVYDTGWATAPTGRVRRSPLSRNQLFPWGCPPVGDFSGFFHWCEKYDRAGRVLEKEVLRSVVNSAVQGLAADVVKLTGTVVDRLMEKQGLKSRLCNNIHDELLVDAWPGEEQDVAKILYDVARYPPLHTAFGFALRVPLTSEVGIGPTWSDAKRKENRWEPPEGQ